MNLLISSDCSAYSESNGNTYLNNVLSFDWSKTTGITEECQKELITQIVYTKDGTNYLNLEQKYIN